MTETKTKARMPIPSEHDIELALRDVNEVGFDCARAYSRFVIEYGENPRSAATKQEFQRWLQNG